MYTLYLDEAGDWGYPNYDPDYPVLCLCGSIIRDEYHSKEIIPNLRSFKRSNFHNAELTIHRHRIRARRGNFPVLKNEKITKAIMLQLSELISKFEITLLISALDKIKHSQMYGTDRVSSWLPEDIYSMLFTFMVERFIAFLWERDKAPGKIIAESRGIKEDNAIQYWYSLILKNGTEFYRNWQFQRVLPTFVEFRKKQANIAGLEISDWIASPMAKMVMYPDGSQDEFREWELYKNKIWLGKNPSIPGQVGFKTFPDNLGRKLLNLPLKSP